MSYISFLMEIRFLLKTSIKTCSQMVAYSETKKELQDMGIRVVMLTGDNERTADRTPPDAVPFLASGGVFPIQNERGTEPVPLIATLVSLVFGLFPAAPAAAGFSAQEDGRTV